jgi:ABC-type uncharacterized transport system fused permease/ATPase subunit
MKSQNTLTVASRLYRLLAALGLIGAVGGIFWGATKLTTPDWSTGLLIIFSSIITGVGLAATSLALADLIFRFSWLTENTRRIASWAEQAHREADKERDLARLKRRVGDIIKQKPPDGREPPEA